MHLKQQYIPYIRAGLLLILALLAGIGLARLSHGGEKKAVETSADSGSWGLSFQEEYSFPDLVSSSGRPLRFDFAIFDDNGDLDFLIEFQGIQHYEAKSKFGGSSGLRKQQFNDMQKREYCRKHNIILLAIPYYDEGKIDYDYIMNAYYILSGD